MAQKLTAEQKRWQAQSDAETMAQYEQIMSDSKRRDAAIKVARTKALELSQRANIMSRVGNSKSTSRKK